MESDAGFLAALEEARRGREEGGVPIGAAIVDAQGKILGHGHNMRVQRNSNTLHVRLLGYVQLRALLRADVLSAIPSVHIRLAQLPWMQCRDTRWYFPLLTATTPGRNISARNRRTPLCLACCRRNYVCM